ncbi:hypothetical protein [Burkholderia ubonensis]|uniref:hypothetical protein n=1 Tax=Burkholderia ubonensis TaxID=101571 RepID=UPI0012FC0E6D|nr:hypothetical protein [Burkholderia ubonensis]
MATEPSIFTFNYTGAMCFGGVIGWTLRYVLAHSKEVSASSLGVIVSSVGGAAVTGIFDPNGGLFAAYCIGLASGFFVHVLLLDIDSEGRVRYRWAMDGDREKAESIFEDEKTHYFIVDEHGKKRTLTLDKWAADVLQAELPDVQAWLQEKLDLVSSKFSKETRRKRGDLVRAIAYAEAGKSPRITDILK